MCEPLNRADLRSDKWKAAEPEQRAEPRDPASLGSLCSVPREESRTRAEAEHKFVHDDSLPHWHGWHAARRGLGSNLYALGIPEKTIQAILRHANVNTTNTYYIKTASADAQAAMAKLESDPAIGQQLGDRIRGSPSIGCCKLK